MSKITLNAEAASALEAITTQSELCAPDGRRLGLFVPPPLAAEVEAHLKRRFSSEPTMEQLKAASLSAWGAEELPHAHAAASALLAYAEHTQGRMH